VNGIVVYNKMLIVRVCFIRQINPKQPTPNYQPTQYSMPILQPRPAYVTECMSRSGWHMNPVLFLGRPGLYYINP